MYINCVGQLFYIIMSNICPHLRVDLNNHAYVIDIKDTEIRTKENVISKCLDQVCNG